MKILALNIWNSDWWK